MDGLTVTLLIGFVFLVVVLGLQPRPTPPRIIYIHTETPETSGGGMGCLPAVILFIIALGVLYLLT